MSRAFRRLVARVLSRGESRAFSPVSTPDRYPYKRTGTLTIRRPSGPSLQFCFFFLFFTVSRVYVFEFLLASHIFSLACDWSKSVT